MLFFLLFFGELLFLFLLSRNLTRTVSLLFYRITKNKKLTIYFLAVLFLPGTFVHELAHYLMAVVLLVHAEGLELMPKIEENNLKLGSVHIERTDPFRRLLIGMAPFLVGTTIILLSLYLALSHHMFTSFWIVLILIYLVFEIGNTMFSSRKDMEGALELLIGLLVLCLFLYFLGIRLPMFQVDAFFALPLVQAVFKQGSLFLAFPIVVDLLFIFLLRFLHKQS
jgi:hypothetical protein